VLNDATYRENARKLQKAIAQVNGFSVAADLVEESLGVTEKGPHRPGNLTRQGDGALASIHPTAMPVLEDPSPAIRT
jgi:hypothetical protein